MGAFVPPWRREDVVDIVDAVIVVANALVLLAVVAGLAGLASRGTESPLFLLTFGTVYAWATTPGVGALEVLVYAAIAVVVLGPAWHWLLNDGPVGHGVGKPDDGSEAFEFTPEASTDQGAPQRLSVANGGANRPLYSLDIEPDRPGWSAELFRESSPTIAVPEGDFLRSASGSVDQATSESTGELPTTDEPPTAERPKVGTNHGRDESSDDPAAPVDESEASADSHDAADVPPSDAAGHGPANPPGRVRDVVGDARSTVESIEDDLARAATDTGVDSAAAALAETADAPARQLQAAISDSDDAVAEVIATARERGRHIEFAIESVIDD